MSLDGRVALVTGASRGIGKAIALRFAEAGADLACADVVYGSASEPGRDATAEGVRSAGRKALCIPCDVVQYEQVKAAVEGTLREFGRVDILVNNAGIARDRLILRMTDDDWEQVMHVNLKGAYHLIKAVARPMMKARYGRIINIASVVGISGQAGQANYAASKAGLIGLTRSVAKEFGGRGITCNAIAPGYIETDMTEDLSEEMRNQIVQNAPLQRLGHTDDVAGAALFLAGDDASYITGQVLVVDGGLTL
ncbi:MAG: 3-oxoacyl-[acyl-carrier-protein] reductase [Armatimonadetes bacterium]|nr:3-oxoacyl-[acyl-carrier-protein] reductase [Armatimonadota bacterium]